MADGPEHVRALRAALDAASAATSIAACKKHLELALAYCRDPACIATLHDARHGLTVAEAVTRLVEAVENVQERWSAKATSGGGPSTARTWCYGALDGMLKLLDVDGASGRLDDCVAAVVEHVVRTLSDALLRAEFAQAYLPLLTKLVLVRPTHWHALARHAPAAVVTLMELACDQLRTCGALTVVDHSSYAKIVDAVATHFPLHREVLFDALLEFWLPYLRACTHEKSLALMLNALNATCRWCALDRREKVLALADSMRSVLLRVWHTHGRHISIPGAVADFYRLVFALSVEPTAALECDAATVAELHSAVDGHLFGSHKAPQRHPEQAPSINSMLALYVDVLVRRSMMLANHSSAPLRDAEPAPKRSRSVRVEPALLAVWERVLGIAASPADVDDTGSLWLRLRIVTDVATRYGAHIAAPLQCSLWAMLVRLARGCADSQSLFGEEPSLTSSSPASSSPSSLSSSSMGRFVVAPQHQPLLWSALDSCVALVAPLAALATPPPARFHSLLSSDARVPMVDEGAGALLRETVREHALYLWRLLVDMLPRAPHDAALTLMGALVRNRLIGEADASQWWELCRSQRCRPASLQLYGEFLAWLSVADAREHVPLLRWLLDALGADGAPAAVEATLAVAVRRLLRCEDGTESLDCTATVVDCDSDSVASVLRDIVDHRVLCAVHDAPVPATLSSEAVSLLATPAHVRLSMEELLCSTLGVRVETLIAAGADIAQKRKRTLGLDSMALSAKLAAACTLLHFCAALGAGNANGVELGPKIAHALCDASAKLLWFVGHNLEALIGRHKKLGELFADVESILVAPFVVALTSSEALDGLSSFLDATRGVIERYHLSQSSGSDAMAAATPTVIADDFGFGSSANDEALDCVVAAVRVVSALCAHQPLRGKADALLVRALQVHTA